ncbi:MAG: hypothetical protein D6767_03090 [Candidatus Hydrogenedentota bacterium]|nr:MAG: hypothetical protein D6767_03090 [Candidatus Hydrogenedentota bacterium]
MADKNWQLLNGEDFDDFEEDEDELDFDDEEDSQIIASYTCEDCDYRWEVTFEDEEEEALEEIQYCPMCGSANTTQI